MQKAPLPATVAIPRHEQRQPGTRLRLIAAIPLYVLALVTTVALSPLLAAGCLLYDLHRRNSLATLRCLLFLFVYLGSEVLGLAIALFMWFGSGRVVGLGRDRFHEWLYALQKWWGGCLFNGAIRIFRITLDVEEPAGLDEGPLMLFIRHVSMADTSLPGGLFLLRHDIRIRHIIKKELLWDPVLNVGGNALRHYFINRSSPDNERELANIRYLTADMGPRDGIMIFPEGTRFTEAKRASILKKLAAKGDSLLLDRARALKNVLPPRLSGSLAMLEANTRAYAVFCAHVGFEAATKAVNLLNGSLVHRTVRVKMWKVPFEKIPAGREQQIEWLLDQWQKIDRWIEGQKAELGTA